MPNQYNLLKVEALAPILAEMDTKVQAAAASAAERFATLTAISASTALTNGKTYFVMAGFNGEAEAFKYVSDSTLTADGALVLATAMATGRLISTRTVFGTVAAMLADVRVLAVGTSLQAVGFDYTVAASAATDHHLTTAGGVKLYVLPNGEGEVSPLAFGAPVDGVNDDATALRVCFNAALANGYTVNLGSEQYTYGSAAGARVDLGITLAAGQSFKMVGTGAVIKDYPGFVQRIDGRFNRTLYFIAPANTDVGHLHLEGFTVNKNGASNTPTGGPGSFEWEQSHCIAIQGTAPDGRYEQITVKDIITREKVGGGIVFSAGTATRVTVDNCHGLDNTYTGGGRGDLELQMTIGDGQVINCSGDFTQLEPNVSTPNHSLKPVLKYTGCDYRTYDLVGFSADKFVQKFHLVNCTNQAENLEGDFWFRNATAYIDGCRLRATGRIDWRNVKSRISDTTLIIGVDTGTNATWPLNISSTTLTLHAHVFSDCKFELDSTADASTTGYAVTNSGAVAIADLSKFNVEMVRCEFATGFQKTLNAYRNGNWILRNCKPASRSGSFTFRAGGTSTKEGRLTLDNCDLSRSNGVLFDVAASVFMQLTFAGQMDYAKYDASNRPPAEWEAKVVDEAVWLADALPTSGGYLHQKVRVRKAPHGRPSEYVCSAGSNTTATWRMSKQAGFSKNTTVNRPTPTSSDIGLAYLDITLDADGKPIWWNGSAWVDATGAVV